MSIFKFLLNFSNGTRIFLKSLQTPTEVLERYHQYGNQLIMHAILSFGQSPLYQIFRIFSLNLCQLFNIYYFAG